MVDAEDSVMLNKLAIASERSNIEAQLEHMWEEKNLDRTIIMKNDGYRKLGKEVADRVRLDYFLSYPSYQAIAKEEIRKYDVLCGQLKRLDEIRSVNLNSGIPQTLQFDHIYVSDGTEMMTVYPEKFLSWAWSDARNNWVSLTPAMRVWQSDAWQPIRLDRQGTIIIINENSDESSG